MAVASFTASSTPKVLSVPRPETLHTAEQSAFSILELLAVLSVTAIMGALASSIYRTYTTRTEVGAGIAAALEVAPLVLYAFEKDGEVPANNETAAISADWPVGDGRLVHALRIVDGRIDIEYGPSASKAIAGRRLSLTPYETATLDVVWICGNAIPGLGLQPLGFSSGGSQSIQLATTIERRYLPRACR